MENKTAQDAHNRIVAARISSLAHASPEYARALLDQLEKWAAEVRAELPRVDREAAKSLTELSDLDPKYVAFYRHERPEQLYAKCGVDGCDGKSEYETPCKSDLCEEHFIEFAREQVRNGQSVSGSIWNLKGGA